MQRGVDSLMILDSNGHKLDANEIDPTGHTEIRSSGGLCLPATVHGLMHYKRRHYNIKHVYYGIGTNDALHGAGEHVAGEQVNYVKRLYQESRRVFPNGRVTILLPPAGIEKVDVDFIDAFSNVIKEAAVPIKQLRTPSMRGKLILPQKVHYNEDGVRFVTGWMQKILPTRPRVFSATSGRTMFTDVSGGTSFNPVWSNSAPTYADSVNHGSRNHTVSFPPQQPSVQPAPPPSRNLPQTSAEPRLVQEVYELVAKLMQPR